MGRGGRCSHACLEIHGRVGVLIAKLFCLLYFFLIRSLSIALFIDFMDYIYSHYYNTRFCASWSC